LGFITSQFSIKYFIYHYNWGHHSQFSTQQHTTEKWGHHSQFSTQTTEKLGSLLPIFYTTTHNLKNGVTTPNFLYYFKD